MKINWKSGRIYVESVFGVLKNLLNNLLQILNQVEIGSTIEKNTYVLETCGKMVIQYLNCARNVHESKFFTGKIFLNRKK